MEKYRLKTKEVLVFKWLGDKSLCDEIKRIIDTINDSDEYHFRLNVSVDSEILCLGVEEDNGYGGKTWGTSFCYKGQYTILDLNDDISPFKAVDKEYIDKYYEIN